MLPAASASAMPPAPAAAEATVRGDTLAVLLAPFRPHYPARLAAHGLLDAPDPAGWYPLGAWLALLDDLLARYGEAPLRAGGAGLVAHSAWPAQGGLHALHEAFYALTDAYRANMCGAGSYSLVWLGLRAVRVVCDTPTPAAFDRGVVEALAHQFRPLEALAVRVDPETPPAGAPPALKWFRVSW